MASTTTQLNTTNFDVSKLVLEKPVPNDKRNNVFSAKLRYLVDDEPTFFLIETPKLFTPFGATSYNDDGKYVLTFTLGNDGKEGEFKKMVEDIDTRVQELIEGLPKKHRNDFYRLVKPPKDPKYKPTFSIKLKANLETKELYANVYDKKKSAISMTLSNVKTELPKRSKVRGLLMMNNVWFVNKNCGITVNAKQLIVYPNKELGCMFNELSDSESEEEEVVEEEEEGEEED